MRVCFLVVTLPLLVLSPARAQVTGGSGTGGGALQIQQFPGKAPNTPVPATANAIPNAANPPEPPATKPEDLATVQGAVRNAATKQPLRKANLTLMMQGGRPASVLATTDSEGKFTLRDIEPGNYRLWVERNGFVRQEYGAKSPSRPGTTLTLGKAQVMKEVTVDLTPQAVITGRITDEDGEPLERVQVSLQRYSFFQGRRRLAPMNSGGTNDLGEYRIFGVGPGKYYLQATHMPSGMIMQPGERASRDDQADGFVPVYYPGVTDSASATPIVITPGQQASNVDLRMTRTRTVRLRGKVFSASSNKPLRNTMVMLIPKEALYMMPNSRGATNDQGTFELRGVTPGSYILQADTMEDGQRSSARLAIEVGNQSLDGLVLTAGAGVEVTGSVKLEGSTAAQINRVRVMVEPKDAGVNFGTGGGLANEGGEFSIKTVMPGRYRVTLYDGGEGLYVKSIRAANVDVLEDGLDLTQGPAGPLTVVMSSDGGQIDGVVNGENKPGIGGATVVLVPEAARRDRPQLFKSATSDQTGHFTLKAIPPGEYKLFAWEDIEPGTWADPDVLKEVESKGTSVTIRENSKETPTLTLIPAGTSGAR